MRNGSSLRKARLIGLSMCLAALLAWVATPKVSATRLPPLAQWVPANFGDWHEVGGATDQVNPVADPTLQNPYDDILMRSYANSRGDVVMVALAYGRSQRQEIKIHRPELCYLAQGYNLISSTATRLVLGGSGAAHVAGARMLVNTPGRTEAVSYWIRIGDMYSESAWATRYYILREGFKGKVHDGILVRVSQIVADGDSLDARYRLQEAFMGELIRAAPPYARRLLLVG